MNFFERYLTVWVAICMVLGVLIGQFLPEIPRFLSQLEVANVSIPVAILIWLMIYPMMMKVDFRSVKQVGQNPKGLYITWIANWIVKPALMLAISSLFFFQLFKGFIDTDLARQYVAGAVLLGAAPCTAMVFVWSHLTKGNPAYTLVQVASNNLIILVAFVPIVKFLLGLSNIIVPWDTLFYSVLFFVVIPLTAGGVTRKKVISSKGEKYFNETFLSYFNQTTIIGLLLTLVLIFSFQGDRIINHSWYIVLIAIPLILQTGLIFFLTYGAAKRVGLSHDIAAPAGLIGASNFFELAVAVAIALFGVASPVALVTIVGVLVEVPVMLLLVRYANKTRSSFLEA